MAFRTRAQGRRPSCRRDAKGSAGATCTASRRACTRGVKARLLGRRSSVKPTGTCGVAARPRTPTGCPAPQTVRMPIKTRAKVLMASARQARSVWANGVGPDGAGLSWSGGGRRATTARTPRCSRARPGQSDQSAHRRLSSFALLADGTRSCPRGAWMRPEQDFRGATRRPGAAFACERRLSAQP